MACGGRLCRRLLPDLGPSGDGVKVPEDHYFVLGDNTGQSSDSRKWHLSAIVLQDGSEILYESSDSDNSPHFRDDGYQYVVDHQGVERHWKMEDEVQRVRRRDRQPFVHRDLVVGRAFFVFWPVHIPGRVGFIH